MQFIDILYKTLTRITFLAGGDAVVIDLGPAALGLGVGVQAAALAVGAGFVAAFVIGGEYLYLRLCGQIQVRVIRLCTFKIDKIKL